MTIAELKAAVQNLREYDHCFISPEGAKKLSAPFGHQPICYVEKATPNEPKGLTLDDGASEAEGIAAEHLAADICRHLKVKFEYKFGRGSQLRACCDALDRWVTQQGLAPPP